jgi:hypothetical protein
MMRKKGSETTKSNSSISDRITNLRTTVDQIPKSDVRLRANPGGAIFSQTTIL